MASPSLVRFYRRAMSTGVVALAATSAGCYEFGPMPMTPRPGRQTVELLLNERGRADFVNTLGPDAMSLEGTLVERKDSLISVNVQSVRYINQSSTKWAGEPLVVTNGQIRDIRNKRFSVGKTGFAVAASVGGLLAFIVTRSLGGGGDSPPPANGGPGIGQ